ncbi:MAG: tripartite tricarboxylate transporter TctB family protein [Xanthobacteraceae bacterium]|nr:tripartite tricarboxylate transporter TctB family protein [Xanthobacteraceae bacterium]
METSKFRLTAPYAIGLGVAAILYYYAQNIEYTPRPGSLGPAFWPKLAIGLMTVTCLFEIVRGLLGFKEQTQGVTETLEKEEESETPGTTYPWLLAGGILLVVAYAVLIDTLGFLLSTFFFLAIFMYLGRYRNHVAIWLTSLGITFAAALLFMRFAYVSLPRGTPPFDSVTDFIRMLVGG